MVAAVPLHARLAEFPTGHASPVLAARTAANRILLDSQHTNLRTELQNWTWATDRELLESHHIDEAAFKDLLANDANSFLQHRGARLRTLVSKFVHDRAGFGAPRIFPAATYYDAEGIDTETQSS